MNSKSYRWEPGIGPSTEAWERMRLNFPVPIEPMGEAWFMGKNRRLYTELQTTPLSDLPIVYVEDVFWEICSGTNCLGHLKEWDDWFRYLLPECVQLGITRLEFFEHSITAFFNIYDAGVIEDYDGFRQDVFSTLPLVLMSPEFWEVPVNKSEHLQCLRPSFLVDIDGAPSGWDGRNTHPAVSASLFFCLRYLKPEEFPSWVRSLTAIQDVYWRSHLLVWLLGVKNLLTDGSLSTRKFRKTLPRLGWGNSVLLETFSVEKGLCSSANLDAFFSAVKHELDLATLLQWGEQISQQPVLQKYLWNVEDFF